MWEEWGGDVFCVDVCLRDGRGCGCYEKQFGGWKDNDKFVNLIELRKFVTR